MRSPTSIRLRLMLIVGLALAPLALASIIQAALNFRAYQRETNRILVQTALYAAYNEQNIFARAEQLLRSLARRPELTANRADCYAALSDALVGAAPIINFTRVDAKGHIVCMGAVAPHKPLYAKLSWWPALRKANRIIVGNQFVSPLLHRVMLPIALPLHDKNGTFLGALSASVDLHWLETAPQVTKLPEGALSVIMDTDGRVLASNHAVPAALSQSVSVHALAGKERVFTIDTSTGERWRWVAEPIGISDKFVAFGIPEPRLLGTFRGYLMADVLLTVLIVLATCAAIWLGTEWLVIRWTIYLKRVAVAYGRNHFSLSLADMHEAPDEFRRLGQEMKRMAAAIQDRDRNLSHALERQSSMTREIHHRVKNNLQIVSSLIAIYAQNISNPVARSAFRQIIVRVDALTLIQRLIEKRDTDPTIDAQVLFEQLADQIRTLAFENNQSFSLTLSIEHHWLSPDIATPIVLFATEVLTFDIFLPRTEAHRRDARLILSSDDAGYQLTIEGKCLGLFSMKASLSDRVLRSLTEQLRGRYTITQLPDGGTKIVLRIPPEGSEAQPNPSATPPAKNIFAFDLSRSRQV